MVRKLAARSDVLIENFKVGGLAKFGLDYKSLAPEYPRLIYCSVTGFGQDGPYASRAGYDLMAQGMGGFMSLTGMADGEPTRARRAGLRHLHRRLFGDRHPGGAGRSASGPALGGYVDTALVDSTVGVLANQALNYLVSGRCPTASATRIPTSCPTRCFPWPTATHHRDRQRQPVRQALRRARRAGARPTRPTDNTGRLANRAALIERAVRADRDIHARRPAGQARGGRRAGRADQHLDRCSTDPQVLHRGMQIEPPSAAAKDGSIPGVRTPIMIDGAPMAADAPPRGSANIPPKSCRRSAKRSPRVDARRLRPPAPVSATRRWPGVGRWAIAKATTKKMLTQVQG